MTLLPEMDGPCPACGQVVGEHTMRQFGKCAAQGTDDRYEEQPNGLTALTEQLGADVVIADHITAKSLVGRMDAVMIGGVVVPIVLHEFQTTAAGGPPVTVAKVAYISDPEHMRKYGKLIRDTANGAANAAERVAAQDPRVTAWGGLL